MSKRSKSPQIQIVTKLSQARLRSKADPTTTILIYDHKLDKLSKEFWAFAKCYPHRYAVDSGENLKSLEKFPAHCKALSALALDLPTRQMTVLSAGGGSVGDFAGFFASVFKRGVRLIHLPTTWLASIDSSHGGKTALNVGGAKNQIGTFYPADFTVIVRSLLSSQSLEQVEDAMGELAKMTIIEGGSVARTVESSQLVGENLLWKFLPIAISAKMKIVNRDPLEEKGLRQILNLGHTMGHVIEASAGFSHGVAVAQGLFFALEFSRAEGLLSDKEFERLMSFLAHLGLAPRAFKPVPAAKLASLLLKDKKRSRSGEVTFIFVRGFGRCERLSVPVKTLAREAKRQGWST